MTKLHKKSKPHFFKNPNQIIDKNYFQSKRVAKYQKNFLHFLNWFQH